MKIMTGKSGVQPWKIGCWGSSSNYLSHISHFVNQIHPAFPTAVGSRFRAVFASVKGSKNSSQTGQLSTLKIMYFLSAFNAKFKWMGHTGMRSLFVLQDSCLISSVQMCMVVQYFKMTMEYIHVILPPVAKKYCFQSLFAALPFR